MHLPAPEIALTYPGQGAYSPGLLGALQSAYPASAPELSRLRAAWLAETGADLDEVRLDPSADIDDLARRDIGLSQLAIFAASTAMHHVLAARLPQPVVHVGHSFGEVAALTCAGVWSLEDGARVVAARVRALSTVAAQSGGMVAISCETPRAMALVQAVGVEDLVVAGHNGPGQVVASGPGGSLQRLECAAAALGISTVRLRSPYAFHSPALRAAAAEFEQTVRTIGWQPLTEPVYSPVLGRYYRETDDLASLVASHLTEPFDFGAAVLALHAEGTRLFIECGGRSALTSAVRRTLGAGGRSAEGSWRAIAGDDGPARLLVEAAAAIGAPAGSGPAVPVPSTTPDGTAELLSTLRELLRADLETITRQMVLEYSGRLPDVDERPVPTPVAEVPATVTVPAQPSPAGAPAESVAPAASPTRAEVLSGLVELYAAALEYPPEVLAEDVELEADLGVDSVKQTELLARAADRFALPAQPSEFVIGEFPTLGHIADLVLRSS